MTQHEQLLYCGGARGCGERQSGGLYACCAPAALGQPLEAFVLDPARYFNGGAFRAPMFAERNDGYFDLVIWIGEKSYPFVPDVLEEGRKRGFSRRVPSEAGSLDLLTQFESRMVLIHPKAITAPTPELPESIWCRCKGEDHACAFHLWALSALESCKGHELVPDVVEKPSFAWVTTPSVRYRVPYPKEYGGEKPEYRPGAFVALPLSHFEYINKEADEVPVKVAEKIHLAGYQVIVCQE